MALQGLGDRGDIVQRGCFIILYVFCISSLQSSCGRGGGSSLSTVRHRLSLGRFFRRSMCTHFMHTYAFPLRLHSGPLLVVALQFQHTMFGSSFMRLRRSFL